MSGLPQVRLHDSALQTDRQKLSIDVRICRDCRKPFRISVGTVFESSHIPLRVWLQAVFLMASSKKGISSNQLSRMLGITLKPHVHVTQLRSDD